MQENRDRIDLLIAKYLSQESTPIELEELKTWTEISIENQRYFQQIWNIWLNAERGIILDNVNTRHAFKLVNKKSGLNNAFFRFWSLSKRIAAILLIPLLLGNIFYFIYHREKPPIIPEPVYNELYATFGTRSAFKLPDGTSVWLNSGSKIRYPDSFKGEERIVFIEGEAYFDVKSDSASPFIVKSPSFCTRVTGTEFNVLDYRGSNYSEVTLVEGNVSICLNTGRDSGLVLSRLAPEQHFVLNNLTGSTEIIKGDTYKYISWKDGKIVFRNDPLTYVIQKLSQIYNVDIELRSKEIESYSYHATFKDESLEEILNLLKTSSPIEYSETKRHPLPDGSYLKRKIIIFSSIQPVSNED